MRKLSTEDKSQKLIKWPDMGIEKCRPNARGQSLVCPRTSERGKKIRKEKCIAALDM